jgi:single-strand DNA-binding protein
MQTLTIAGNCGKDAELRNTQGGDAVLSFSLAADNGKDRDGNKRPATWYDCSIWGKRATSLQNHISKGTKLVLMGRPTVRVHEGKAYLGISVDQLTFMGGGSEQRQDDTGGGYGGGQGGNGGGYGGDQGGGNADDYDSIPF